MRILGLILLISLLAFACKPKLSTKTCVCKNNGYKSVMPLENVTRSEAKEICDLYESGNLKCHIKLIHYYSESL